MTAQPGLRSILTVTSSSNTYDLTVLKTVKLELGIADKSKDEIIGIWIRQASGAIASYCNRVFAKETLQEEFWPERNHTVPGNLSALQLTRWPVVSVTSVVENAVTLVDGTDFRIDYQTGQLTRLGSSGYPCSWHAWPIVVVYVAGYDLLQTLPVDIERAAISLVKKLYFSAKRDPSLRAQEIDGVISNTYWIASGAEAGMLPPDVTDMLDSYRVPVAA